MRSARLQGCGLLWRGHANSAVALKHVSPHSTSAPIGCIFDYPGGFASWLLLRMQQAAKPQEGARCIEGNTQIPSHLSDRAAVAQVTPSSH